MTNRQTCAHDGCQTLIMYQRFYNGGRWAHVVQYDSEGHPVTHDHTARPVPVVTNEFPWEE